MRADPKALRNGLDLLRATKTAYICEDLWHEFVMQFVTNLDGHFQRPAGKWVLLVVDGHSSHFSIKTIHYAFRNRVFLLTLVPHSSAEMQVEDVALFGPLKKEYARLVSTGAIDGEMPDATKDWSVRYIACALRNVLAPRAAAGG